jgi:hypothetical protein
MSCLFATTSRSALQPTSPLSNVYRILFPRTWRGVGGLVCRLTTRLQLESRSRMHDALLERPLYESITQSMYTEEVFFYLSRWYIYGNYDFIRSLYCHVSGYPWQIIIGFLLRRSWFTGRLHYTYTSSHYSRADITSLWCGLTSPSVFGALSSHADWLAWASWA